MSHLGAAGVSHLGAGHHPEGGRHRRLAGEGEEECRPMSRSWANGKRTDGGLRGTQARVESLKLSL